MLRSARGPAATLAATAALALAAGLTTVAPASAVSPCGPAPASNNNTVGNQAPVANNDTATALAGTTIEIPVLANDTDPEGDVLALVNAGTASRAETCATSAGTVRFQAEASPTDYTVSFRYGMSDGDRYRSATVTVAVTGLKPVLADVRTRLRTGPGGKVTRPARVAITNRNSVPVTLLGGNVQRDELSFQRTVGAGKTIVLRTRIKQLGYIAVLEQADGAALVNVTLINTRTGRVRSEYIGESFDDGLFRLGARGSFARVAS